MLTAEALGFAYGRTPVLRGVDLVLDSGVCALIGRNGAGKTTLIEVLAGVRAPQTGSIRLNGESVTHGSLVEATGLMVQTAQSPSWLSCHDYLTYAGYLAGLGWGAARKRSAELLDRFSLGRVGADPPSALSGGMRRRLSLAEALVVDPPIILLDEPTAGLDPKQRDSVLSAIRQLGEDKAVLVSTHVIEDIATVATRVAVLAGGEISHLGSVAAFADPQAPENAGPTVERLRQAVDIALGPEDD